MQVRRSLLLGQLFVRPMDDHETVAVKHSFDKLQSTFEDGADTVKLGTVKGRKLFLDGAPEVRYPSSSVSCQPNQHTIAQRTLRVVF